MSAKINTEMQMLDQLTAELVKVRASGTGTSQAAEARDSIEKPFSHWIRGAPKEKLSFLYDTNGIRYGIQTTNHAECYMAASINISNSQIQFCTRVT